MPDAPFRFFWLLSLLALAMTATYLFRAVRAHEAGSSLKFVRAQVTALWCGGIAIVLYLVSTVPELERLHIL